MSITERKPPAAVHQLSQAREKKQQQTSRRLLALAEVESRCRMKKSRVYQGMADGTFPKCIHLPHSRSVAWVEADIFAWIDTVLIANGRAPDAPQAGQAVATSHAADSGASQGGAE